MSGSELVNQRGVYGNLSEPSNTTSPGARWSPIHWTDATQRLCLFGGVFFNSSHECAKLTHVSALVKPNLCCCRLGRHLVLLFVQWKLDLDWRDQSDQRNCCVWAVGRREWSQFPWRSYRFRFVVRRCQPISLVVWRRYLSRQHTCID
jgi:hypothetical protein